VLLGCGVAWCFRAPLLAQLAEYFPDGKDRKASGDTPPPKKKKGGYNDSGYKRVEKSQRDDDTNSQTSCGLADDVDPAAEEWAARLAAQREGREYKSPDINCTTLACEGSASGAGPIPDFAGRLATSGLSVLGARQVVAPADEAFAGFDGFDGEPTEEFDERDGRWSHLSGVAAGSTCGQPLIGQSAAPQGAPPVDYGQLETLGRSAPPISDIDWGILADPEAISSARIDVPFVAGDDINSAVGRHEQEDAEDMEFTVFDGFQDNKPVRITGDEKGRVLRETGAGLSWDEERKQWEKKNKGIFGRPGRIGGSTGSPWDLRAAPVFRSPASLQRLRKQAEKVFDDAIGSSLFSSPTMRHFQKQTNELIGTVQNTLNSVSSIFKGWSSWFG